MLSNLGSITQEKEAGEQSIEGWEVVTWKPATEGSSLPGSVTSKKRPITSSIFESLMQISGPRMQKPFNKTLGIDSVD
jgi:hypothetical protein